VNINFTNIFIDNSTHQITTGWLIKPEG